MLGYFQPRYRKEARLILKNARKMLHAQRDIMKPAAIEEMEAALTRLRSALDGQDRAAVEKASANVEEKFGKSFPPQPNASWRENVEVFLVAIVVALGVRTYFLQPFTIPTGSMQPTLNGIIGYPTLDAPPNPFIRAVDFALHGRKYLNTIATVDDEVVEVRDHSIPLMPWTDVIGRRSSYRIFAPADTLAQYFGVHAADFRYGAATQLTAGKPVVRGYFETGDHVFVDKFTYNFSAPKRSDVFVFTTANIAGIEDRLRMQHIEGSQYYIKRLAGTPGDTLRIESPQLFVNGKLAEEPGFQRVMSQQNGYRGYGQGDYRMKLLSDPESPFTLPPGNYLALGDNSYNSEDSRYWGTVPQENIMGRALFVYWPFIPHWGMIH